MKNTFAINGFGRIGRPTCRIWHQHFQDKLELTAINTSGSMSLPDWAHLLKYDSSYGKFEAEITVNEHQSHQEVSDNDPVLGTLAIDGHEITVTAQRDPNKLPWDELGVDMILEATGIFCTRDKASLHLQAGAKKVLLTAPGKSEGISTSVLGVNDFDLSCDILSNASCTTNCVAPVVQFMHEQFGVEKATLTTTHAYTVSQNLLDNSHKDLRRGRSAAVNIAPTTTGAAQATTQIITELDQRFDGLALRVPVATVSLADLVFVTSRETNAKEVNHAFIRASQEERWQSILATSQEPLVSSDIIGRSESSIVDLEFTQVIAGDLVKILSWYDNEWGYCHRLLDQLVIISAG